MQNNFSIKKLKIFDIFFFFCRNLENSIKSDLFITIMLFFSQSYPSKMYDQESITDGSIPPPIYI